jgi:hypothetical protein
VGSRPFLVADALGSTHGEGVATAGIFGRVDRKQAFVSAALLDPDHRVGRQPIMGVDDVEAADQILDFEDAIH